MGLTPAFHIKNKRGKISDAKKVRNIVAFFSSSRFEVISRTTLVNVVWGRGEEEVNLSLALKKYRNFFELAFSENKNYSL